MCAHQVLGVARAFYAGQPDLVLLVVDPGLLAAPLRDEPPVPTGAMVSPAGVASCASLLNHRQIVFFGFIFASSPVPPTTARSCSRVWPG